MEYKRRNRLCRGFRLPIVCNGFFSFCSDKFRWQLLHEVHVAISATRETGTILNFADRA